LVNGVYQLINGLEMAENVRYPAISFNVTGMSVGEIMTSITLDLEYADRQVDGTDRHSILEAQTVGMRVLTELLNGLKSYNIRINSPINFTPFKESDADLCAGVTATVTVVYKSDIGSCVYECP